MPQHPGSIWIDNNWEILSNNKWLAASGAGIEAEEETHSKLLDKLREKEIAFSTVTIAFKTNDPIQ